jgi:hypothetical protein
VSEHLRADFSRLPPSSDRDRVQQLAEITELRLATHEEPRLDFLLHEYLPSACRNMKTDREFERIRQEVGGFAEWIEEE